MKSMRPTNQALKSNIVLSGVNSAGQQHVEIQIVRAGRT
jgi:hypothetical protein